MENAKAQQLAHAPHAMAPIQFAKMNPEYLRDWSPEAL
jgi:hypothetical protein